VLVNHDYSLSPHHSLTGEFHQNIGDPKSQECKECAKTKPPSGDFGIKIEVKGRMEVTWFRSLGSCCNLTKKPVPFKQRLSR